MQTCAHSGWHAVKIPDHRLGTVLALQPACLRPDSWTNSAPPAALGADEVAAFLTSLATRDHVSASTQNQALSALLFLYDHVVRSPLGTLPVVTRVRTPPRRPVVLTRGEVRQRFANLEGVPRLVAARLYGSGMRLLEGLSLRVKDLDLERLEIIVR